MCAASKLRIKFPGTFNLYRLSLLFSFVFGSSVFSQDLSIQPNAVSDPAGLTILNGGSVFVSTGTIVTIADFIDVKSGGSFDLMNGANLFQTNCTAKNTGIVNLHRNSSPLLPFDYTYWSSPTIGSQTLKDFSPNSNPKYFLTYDNNWKYVSASSATFTPGLGYAILCPMGTSAVTPTSVPFKFSGTPNNGEIRVPVVKYSAGDFLKLVGNPYPSSLDADKFIDKNIYDPQKNPTGTITGTIYYWTHNFALDNGQYTSNNYATYNKTGGTISTNGGHANTTMPHQFLASGQGFMVETVNAGDVIFLNNMRTGGTNVNFYRTDPLMNSSQSRIWLNFTTNKGANVSQILVGYVQNATNDYDPGFDGTYKNTSNTGIYSLLGDGLYTIQARAVPFVDTDVIPLGYTTDENGEATISIDSVDGLFLYGQPVLIEDKLLNVVHNFINGPYIFSTGEGTFNERFTIKYTVDYLGKDDLKRIPNAVVISSDDRIIKIHSANESIAKVYVYDVLGRQIYQNSGINANDCMVSDLGTKQILIVKVYMANGQSVTKKVIY